MNNTATSITGGKHGTKWIGGLTILSGVLSGVDPTMVPPTWLPWITLAAGALTVVRGAVNTSNAQPPQR